MMKISVAIAAYKGEKFIGEQLSSISAQTVVPDEVVICDDSPDNATEKAVMKFADMLNIRYFRNEKPLGAAANFSKALSLCTGEVIFLCDQDDLWYPHKVSKMCRLLTPGKVSAVFCDSDITDADSHPQNFTHLQSRGYGGLLHTPAGKWQGQFEQSCRRFPAAGHDMAFTKEFLEKLLPLPELKNCHDNYLGVAGAALDAWNFIPESLGTFRRHEQSTSAAGKKISLFNQLHEARESVKNNTFSWNAELFTAVLEKLPELPDERKKLLEERITHSENRAGMPKCFFKRIPPVVKEWKCGNYKKFGRGWKNLVQDLFLR